MEIEQFDELVELWDEEGQPPDIDWLEHAQDFRNQTQKLETENERLRTRNHQGTYCAYCGEEFSLDTNHTYLRVGIHIWECEKHPLNVLCEEIEERCKDLDHDAQEHLETRKAYDLFHATGIHKSIDRIREVINDGKRHCKEMRDELDALKEGD